MESNINQDEIMKDFNINKQLDAFCRNKLCYLCDGFDYFGEPNGYGCGERDEYVSDLYDTILEERLKALKISENEA